ncbi:ribbon-helix-helix domain-containing protein [Salinigranum halophilum]|uniref:ribbon-helix-helix domain-containing protein n=1 Tax=Salinigranum halophilum TaxID=2565931 RepID=UPI0010A8F08F|nr:ribbon-helix-helix domain-containing protein [Salinigranum halophilum]
MKYASVSVKFPVELDTEIERFLDETGIYTNKSEFIKEACRTHLRELNDDTAIAALRLEQLLAQAEQSRESDSEIDADLAALGEKVDADDLERAVEEAREETSEQVYGSDA